ncbi:hypothetical protein A3C87_01955 [Candidatus Kaiserbacteria bacterium RIFCSPHIGHO2_02_FULL_49_34]|uniref:Methylated-DNA-[protein]-cysteine S-methyltransferase DNA binding domain-containing protein n=1 Tax=Candidatus Kaiserbacteria bacterium RIFCSPHIGHO2_02_FULL_49_34 TaxID=1798491 RepID=A0A1F6DHW3_9BACT|nr:MAG: hypothetical protein A3C87_01955 [Candidatus Kaiserbacteria bacterium RIFCSPHIGHO2_02_FULL_49_34]
MKDNAPHGKKTFSERVVALARSVPEGRVTTYGDLAKAAGGTLMASRSISSILGKAYEQGITDIHWHRIVYSNGKVWIDEKHAPERTRLYKNEGIELDMKGRIINFNDLRY